MMHSAPPQSGILRAAELSPLLFTGVMAMLTLIYAPVIRGSEVLFRQCVASAGFFILAMSIARILPARIGPWLRLGAFLCFFSFLFQAIAPLQLLFHGGWMDPELLRFEEMLTGVNIVRYLERFIYPLLTEWLMFSYVAYVPLLFVAGMLCYLRGGESALHTYLLDFALANMICYAGFVIYPVAGPMFFSPGEYTAPMTGGIFTSLGLAMRSGLHYAGGSLPSPHCALATVMLVAIHRNHRKAFRLLLPVLISIYPATVYCRYHYFLDVPAGIGAGLLAIAIAPHLARGVGILQLHASSFSAGSPAPAKEARIRSRRLARNAKYRGSGMGDL